MNRESTSTNGMTVHQTKRRIFKSAFYAEITKEKSIFAILSS